MRVNPLKTLLYAVFCAAGAVYLSGCVEPVNLASFVNDESVADIIDRGDGIVNVSHDSDAGLEAGNKKITGLKSGKYYVVEEWDENGKHMSTQVVSATGERSESLTGIGAVTGKEITGLTNYYNYRVRAAEPLPGNVSYNILSPQSSGIAENTDGVINLEGPENAYTVYTFPPPLPPPPFEVVEISISPVRPTMHAELFADGGYIARVGQKRVIDYVFLQSDSKILPVFYVLQVVSVLGSAPPTDPANITINVTLSYGEDHSPQTTSTPISYVQGYSTPIKIIIDKASDYDTTAGITWYFNNELLWTGSDYQLIPNNIRFNLIGTFTITVEAVHKDSGGFYSTTIEVTVTSPP